MAKTAPFVIAEILRLRNEKCMTFREIAAVTKVSIPTISRIMRAAGIPAAERVRPHAGRLEIDHVRVMDLYERGKSYSEIAALIGVSRTKIYYVINPERQPARKSAALRNPGAAPGHQAANPSNCPGR